MSMYTEKIKSKKHLNHKVKNMLHPDKMQEAPINPTIMKTSLYSALADLDTERCNSLLDQYSQKLSSDTLLEMLDASVDNDNHPKLDSLHETKINYVSGIIHLLLAKRRDLRDPASNIEHNIAASYAFIDAIRTLPESSRSMQDDQITMIAQFKRFIQECMNKIDETLLEIPSNNPEKNELEKNKADLQRQYSKATE